MREVLEQQGFEVGLWEDRTDGGVTWFAERRRAQEETLYRHWAAAWPRAGPASSWPCYAVLETTAGGSTHAALDPSSLDPGLPTRPGDTRRAPAQGRGACAGGGHRSGRAHRRTARPRYVALVGPGAAGERHSQACRRAADGNGGAQLRRRGRHVPGVAGQDQPNGRVPRELRRRALRG